MSTATQVHHHSQDRRGNRDRRNYTRSTWCYETPPSGTGKVLLLTVGCTEIIGHWREGAYLAWAPIPVRDIAKEREINQKRARS